MAAGDVIVIKENAFSKKGVYFDGTDDYILVDAHAAERVAANDTVGTYSAWVYVDSYPSHMTVLSAGDNDSANEFLEMGVGSTGVVRFKLTQGGATQFLLYGGSVPTRTWTHIVWVQDGVLPKAYMNGSRVTLTVDTQTDLTMWYDELANCDKFAIGVLESNNTHTQDFKGAIGQVKYWATNLSPEEIAAYHNYERGTYTAAQLTAAVGSTRETALNALLRLNITMVDDGTTDSGLGADNGTLTGHAHYGGEISAWSFALERNSSGHAAEAINTFRDVDKYVSIIKRGD